MYSDFTIIIAKRWMTIKTLKVSAFRKEWFNSFRFQWRCNWKGFPAAIVDSKINACWIIHSEFLLEVHPFEIFTTIYNQPLRHFGTRHISKHPPLFFLCQCCADFLVGWEASVSLISLRQYAFLHQPPFFSFFLSCRGAKMC